MKKKILVLEDDPDILYTLNIVLQNAGYEVELLSSGQSIMDGTYNRPDLFILDKRMPDMDGLDVCRHLRKENGSQQVPVIVISATPQFGSHAIRAGANDFLEKPFTIKNLLSMVARYINH